VAQARTSLFIATKIVGMKNRYLKNARIPEKKVQELLHLFCEDLTATQMANISRVSRITVNAYLKLIRIKIAQFCEETNPSFQGYSIIQTIRNKQIVDGAYSELVVEANHFYGIYKSGQAIYTMKVPKLDADALHEWIHGKVNTATEVIKKNKLELFDAIADFNRGKLIRANKAPHFTKGKSKIDEIDLFWGIMKSRILKFRGMNSNTLYLHIKESEFRYNYRNTDLFSLIHSLILKRPLHYLRENVLA
jgi:transposase